MSTFASVLLKFGASMIVTVLEFMIESVNRIWKIHLPDKVIYCVPRKIFVARCFPLVFYWAWFLCFLYMLTLSIIYSFCYLVLGYSSVYFYSVQNHRYACLLIHLNCFRRWDLLTNADSFIVCFVSGASIVIALLDFIGNATLPRTTERCAELPS